MDTSIEEVVVPSLLERPAVSSAASASRLPTGARRFGYVAAAGVNALLLWVANQLLAWGWPGFLTEDFTDVLGIVSASLVAGIIGNLVLAVRYSARLRAVVDLVTAGFAVAVGLRVWAVFPFDFTGYATDWSGALRAFIVLVVAGCGIAMLASFFTLVAGAEDE